MPELPCGLLRLSLSMRGLKRRKGAQVCRFFTVSLATAVAILVGGAHVALAATCDPQNNPYEAGYAHGNGNTSVGASASTGVDLVSDSIFGGSVRGFISVDTNNDTNNLIVGIRDTGSGPQIYFEQNGVFHGTWSVNYQQFYSVSISRDSTNGYTAHWNGHSYSATLGPNSNNETDFFATSSNPGTNCNGMDFYFRNLSPWTTSQMTGFPFLPYQLNTISDTEFEVHGP